MKQISVNDSIRSKLQAAAGANVDLSNLAVFRATAINTLPIRKKHPVYNGGIHKRSFLEQMLAALKQESLPLQIMHNSEVLPSGRVFDGEIKDLGTHSELHTYFWVDKSTAKGVEYTNLINSGTIDQVSVSVLPKAAVSNKSTNSFDFLGDDATFEHIWSGTDPDGNVMGKEGAYVEMNDLDAWFEMSLVGQGGITGARIHSSGDMKLAASGLDVPPMTLTLAYDEKDKTSMDLEKLVEQLTDAKAALKPTQEQLTAAQAEIETLKARITELEAAGDAAPLNEALTGLFTFAATLSGDVTAKAPEKVEDLVAAVKENVNKLRSAPASRTLDASYGSGDKGIPSTSNAFKRAR